MKGHADYTITMSFDLNLDTFVRSADRQDIDSSIVGSKCELWALVIDCETVNILPILRYDFDAVIINFPNTDGLVVSVNYLWSISTEHKSSGELRYSHNGLDNFSCLRTQYINEIIDIMC